MAIGQKYHISLNEDGKWQVKGEKAGKALKLFDTQKEAIAYAKTVAGNQEGNIVIHKVDGKIRKQDYTKKDDKKEEKAPTKTCKKEEVKKETKTCKKEEDKKPCKKPCKK